MAIGSTLGLLIGTLASAGAGVGGTVYGAKKQSSAAKKAAEIQAQRDREALELQREAMAENRRQFDAEQEEKKKAFEAEQAELGRQTEEEQRRYNALQLRQDCLQQRDEARWQARETQMAPYRTAGAHAVNTLSSLAGAPATATGGPRPYPGMAAGAAPPVPTGAPAAAYGPQSMTLQEFLRRYGAAA